MSRNRHTLMTGDRHDGRPRSVILGPERREAWSADWRFSPFFGPYPSPRGGHDVAREQRVERTRRGAHALVEVRAARTASARPSPSAVRPDRSVEPRWRCSFSWQPNRLRGRRAGHPRSLPSRLRLFLLALTIVDDIGAVLVIAIFYSGSISFAARGAAVGLLALMVLLRRVQVQAGAVYLILGVGVWLAVFESGVHATIAGVALAFVTPAIAFQRPHAVSGEARRIADETSDDPTPADADAPPLASSRRPLARKRSRRWRASSKPSTRGRVS